MATDLVPFLAAVPPWIWAAGGAGLLALTGVVQLFSSIARMRDAAEQVLSAARVEADATRAQVQSGERALSARLEQARLESAEGAARLTLLLESKLREIEHAVGSQLHTAVERQMTASFGRVLEQFAAMQKAMGEVAAVSAGIGDLKRIFSNVKTRGGWGETQLRALLDDLLPPGAYAANVPLGEGRVVEFAVRLPGQGDRRPWLPIDAKMPLADYERLITAAEAGDAEAERTARRALEQALRVEAKRIASKYIVPPETSDFAVLYLPTDGLYAEAARMPGLVDELGRDHRVLLMGPGLLPGLLRTVHVGYVSLALEQKADQIGRLLGATRQEMLRMDEVLERLSRNAGAMSRTIDDARTRTRVVARSLEELDGQPVICPPAGPQAGETHKPAAMGD